MNNNPSQITLPVGERTITFLLSTALFDEWLAATGQQRFTVPGFDLDRFIERLEDDDALEALVMLGAREAGQAMTLDELRSEWEVDQVLAARVAMMGWFQAMTVGWMQLARSLPASRAERRGHIAAAAPARQEHAAHRLSRKRRKERSRK